MLDSVLLYLTLAVAFLGFVSILIPLRFLRIRTRRAGVGIMMIGILLAIIIAMWPVSEKRATKHETRLDDFMPVWQFDERHEIAVASPPDKVFDAILQIPAEDIRFFRLLTAIRRGGRKLPEGILNAPPREPILDVATRNGFVWLANERPREIVVGTVVVAPRVLPKGAKLTPEVFSKKLMPGIALATMNFLVTPDGRGGSTVTTETRVYANDAKTTRRFAVYWRVIHPGSDIIRRSWLRAIKERAEGR